eukprot:6763502-Pyramimonas_sp.AAC.1
MRAPTSISRRIQPIRRPGTCRPAFPLTSFHSNDRGGAGRGAAGRRGSGRGVVRAEGEGKMRIPRFSRLGSYAPYVRVNDVSA